MQVERSFVQVRDLISGRKLLLDVYKGVDKKYTDCNLKAT